MSGHVLARTLRATGGRLAVRCLVPTRFIGLENVPAGGAVLAGNHVSYLDPVLLWCGSPRPVHFMAKKELWDSRFLAWVLPLLWAFPVHRGEPDRAAIATATDLLRSGELVGVFPEGTRSADGSTQLGEAHGGAAFLALRAGVPIVPTAFVGTERLWPRGARFPRRGRVTISFGAPIDPASVMPDAGRKERVREITRIVMEAIAAEIERARGG